MDRLPRLEPARLRDLLGIQSDFMTAMSRSLTFDESLRHCYDAAVRAGGMDCGGLYLREEDGGVRLVFHDGLSPEYVGKVSYYPPGSSEADLVQAGRTISIGMDQHAVLPPDIAAEGLRSATILPTTCDGRVVGCLNLASRIHAVVPEEARQVLESLAGTMGQIIERERAIAALKESEANLATFFGSVSELLFVLDENGVIRRVNRAVLQRLGYAEQDLLGKPVLYVHPEERRREAAEVMQEMLAGRREFCSVPLETSEGEPVPVETFATLSTWNGRPAIFGVSRDIGERVRAEARQRDLERQVRQAQKLDSLGVLAGGVAHDFNNILMSVLANASLALGDLPPDSPARPSLEEILASSRRAADLCRQLLAYSGRGSVVIEPLDLIDLIREMANLMRSSVSKKVEFCLYLTGDLPPVQGDASQIRQVVMNLVMNASEAMEDLGGTITLSAGVADCTAEDLAGLINGEDLPPGEYVFLQVGDTGCGMDETTLARLFDPFFSTKFTGRGLGMSAVLGIVRAHRGALSVRSEPDSGSVFRILLPAAVSRFAPAGQPRASLSELDSDRCVLLVDDERDVRKSARRLLERLGLRVITAVDGMEALDIHAKRTEEIDLVILDMTMPRLDGLETFRILQERDPELGVILTSGYTEREIRTKFDGCDPAAFLQKPYDLDQLREVLQRFLDVRERESIR